MQRKTVDKLKKKSINKINKEEDEAKWVAQTDRPSHINQSKPEDL